MSSGNYLLLKIILLGDPGVGKTGLFMRFTDNSFSETTTPTITDFSRIQRQIDGRDVVVQLWDTAGAMSFDTLLPTIFTKAHGVIMVYDINNYASFESILSNWIGTMEKNKHRIDPNCAFMLVGNKNDLTRHVPVHTGDHLAKNNDFSFIETSAKNNDSIGMAFDMILRQILKGFATPLPQAAGAAVPVLTTKIVDLSTEKSSTAPSSGGGCTC